MNFILIASAVMCLIAVFAAAFFAFISPNTKPVALGKINDNSGNAKLNVGDIVDVEMRDKHFIDVRIKSVNVNDFDYLGESKTGGVIHFNDSHIFQKDLKLKVGDQVGVLHSNMIFFVDVCCVVERQSILDYKYEGKTELLLHPLYFSDRHVKLK